MTTDDAEIGARWWTESVEAVLAIGADPAIERHARVGPATAIGMFVGLIGQLADQVAAFGRGEPRVDRFANYADSRIMPITAVPGSATKFKPAATALTRSA